MATVNLTTETFDATTEAEGIVLVDFWAAWCGPCRRFGPVFEKISELHPDVVFAKLDTEAEQEIADRLSITSIPTLMIFRDGILLFADAGAMPGKALEDLIAQACGLDMAEVRRQVAAESAASAAS